MIKEADKFIDSNIFEGILSIRSIISANNCGANKDGTNDRKIHKVLFDKAKVEKKSRELRYLETNGCTIEFADSEVLDKMTIGNTHGGIVAVCGERTFPSLSTDNIKPNGFYVMLEGVEDPYNFGYSLRTMYAAGVDGIVLTPRNWMGAAGVVCRASAGASELFPMSIAESDAADVFKSAGYNIVCADIKNAVSIYETELRYPIFLIIGGEKRGISRTLLDKADKVIKLDYGRDFKGALSTASAASVITYEIYRQNLHN